MRPHLPRWDVMTPCLLVETDRGLVLVDTGLGVHDHVSPSPVVRAFSLVLRVTRDVGTTALHQLSRLGHRPETVAHIVLTHLHFDHAGGLPDFPDAQVHVHRRELRASLRRRWLATVGYDRADFAHGPRWVPYNALTERWCGLDAIRLPFDPEMLLIPLFGHTRGHCGVAIRAGEGWLFQCGDALPTNAKFDLVPQWLNRPLIGPHVPRLRALAAAHPEVRMLAGHMWR